MSTGASWHAEVARWRRARADMVRYTDGTRVQEGDRIRYHQAPGGLLPHGDWRYGVAVAGSEEWPELVLLCDEDGHPYTIAGHVIERAEA